MSPEKHIQATFYIETYGCQMNKYDSEIIAGLLTPLGYMQVESTEEAEIILLNTCSVRDHAEKRVRGRIGVLSQWKRQQPGRRLVVVGCMARRLDQEILSKSPHVDFVVGPDQYRALPGLLESSIRAAEEPASCIEEIYEGILPLREPGSCGWVAISRGCDNFCSYCIVPYVRGRERSRSADTILAEVCEMEQQGFKEVTLLGQNVNSYRDGNTDFPCLLERIARESGIQRIRFMTSHPKDLSPSLVSVMADNPPVCPHLHLPVQSGSNRILELMNRQYTRERVINLIDMARKTVPGISVTTDLLVGFAGETETDFQETMDLMERVRFEDAYTYRYSPRPGTAAAGMEQVPEPERLKRLDAIIRLQRRITLEKKRELIGRTLEVLPEAISKQSDQDWMGRSPANWVVVFPKEHASIGQTIDIRIEECRGTTLRGNPVLTHILV